MGQNKRKPQSGDMIQINQPFHQHWALYLGDGYVIHLTPVGKDKVKLGAHKVPVYIRMVKKERLKKVVRHNKWRVNNKSDVSPDPLPVEEIMSRAAACIGKKVVYRSFGRNCEHFVTNLRYEGTVSLQKAFIAGESHILDMRNFKEYPIPGDLIEIDRPLYQHWALYVGNGYVIHVTPIGENSPPSSAGSMSLLFKKAKVEKDLLDKAAGKDNWRVNNKYDNVLIPFPVEEIIRRAERQVGRVVPYFLLYKNCEHFVTKLRYGEAVSQQAMTALEKIRTTVDSVMTGAGTLGLSVLAGLTFPAALPVVASNGIILLYTICIRNLCDRLISDKFMKAKIYTLEQTYC